MAVEETEARPLVPRLQPTKNPQIFGEGGEGRSGYEILTEGGDGMERVSSTKVKLKRAQGECLDIRSRRRT